MKMLVLGAAIAAAPAADAATHRPTQTFLALGDSYTIGENVEPAGRWPAQLAHALQAEGIAIGDPRIIAVTGWTTDELSAAIDEARPASDYGLVTLLIGVNDQYRGRDVGEYADQFERLLERAIGFAGGRSGRVMVLSIPDWGVTPFAAHSGRDLPKIAHEIDAFNTTAERICKRHHVAYVDITPVSRAHGAEPAMLAEDGLHPSAAMYAQWAARALPVARRSLQQQAKK